MAVNAFQVVYLAASLLMVALGIVLLVVNRESAVNRALALVFFARGGLVVFGQAGLPTLAIAEFLSLAGFIVVPFTVLLFLLTYRGHYKGRSPRPAVSLAILGTALALEVILIAIPELLVVGLGIGPPGTADRDPGPLFFVFGFLTLSYTAISLILAADFAHSPTPILRMPLLLISAAFLLDPLFLVIGPLAAGDIASALTLLVLGELPPGFQLWVAVGLSGATLACGLGAVAFVVSAFFKAREPQVRRATGLYIAAAAATIAVSVVVGLVIGTRGVLLSQVFAGVDGLLTLAAPLLVAYAILRYQVFDLDLRLKDGIRRASVVGLYALAFGAAVLLLNPFFGISVALVAGVLAAALLLLMGRPVRSAAKRVADAIMPKVEATPDYIMMRKLEVYRTALEEAQARGSSAETEERVLQELRKSLGVSDDAHRAMLLMLRAHGRKQGELTSATRAKFRIERQLGQGGFGKVYLAHDGGLDRQVVLKQPTGLFAQDENSRRLFLKEARIAARIHHPNVVTVHQVIEEEDPPMLVMEFVDGGSLADKLVATPRLSPAEAVRVALDVLAGLDRIHREGIVHRDVKPANILLTREGVAKVTDFGIAHADRGASALVTVAGTGYQPGSLAYMSPEQARGDAVDARTDLYSLGIVLHEALTGRHYLGSTEEGDYRLRTRVQTDVPLMDDVPEPLRPALVRALAKDLGARFESASAMSLALEMATTGSRPRATTSGAAVSG